MSARRFLLIATASGSGKTTLGRELARRLDLPFVELDAWVHGPGWQEVADGALQERLEPVLARDGWVVDGSYFGKLGTRALDAADLVIWLDPPARRWLVWLLRRTLIRVIARPELWNGNRETWRNAFWGRDSLFGFTLTEAPVRRREWPALLSRYPVIRLRSPDEMARFLERLT